MLVGIGGHGRNVGKTSVIVGLIRSLAEVRWTAVKLSPHRHKPKPGPGTDTARFLEAGAVHSYLLADPSELGPILESGANVIVESNQVVDFVKPDLFLMVLDFSVAEFKESARRYMAFADGYIIIDRGTGQMGAPERKPQFPVRPPEYTSRELTEFVRVHAVRKGNATETVRPPAGIE